MPAEAGASPPPPPPHEPPPPEPELDIAAIDADLLRSEAAQLTGAVSAAKRRSIIATLDDAQPLPPPSPPPIAHHYALVWRYGQHSVTSRRMRRETLTPYNERAVHRYSSFKVTGGGWAQRRAALYGDEADDPPEDDDLDDLGFH